MKITHLSVVTLDYTVSDTSGEVLDTTEGREPLVYLHGSGYLVPGLENALYERAAGDSFELTVPAADAYGEYEESLVQEVPGELFDGMEVAEGDTFVADTDDGHRPVTIVEVSENFVKVDANHPLAGQPVRAADELATLIYTSGTTGLPKGVMHSFGNFAWALTAALGRFPMSASDRLLSYLPLAHVFERAWIECAAMVEGSGHIFFADEYYGYDDGIYAALRLARIVALRWAELG